MKLSIHDYLQSPCRSASIPYWKQKNLILPKNLKIVHNDEYNERDFSDYSDEPYFRLYHNLKSIRQHDFNDAEIIVAKPELLAEFVEIINASYTDLSISYERLQSLTATPVYRSDLWILLKDKASDNFVGCGIADFDCEIGELVLEWIQVLPQYRRRGYGSLIVNYLLGKMQNIANFATVSGKLNDSAKPEKLYRKCGFTGSDVWHILHKK